MQTRTKLIAAAATAALALGAGATAVLAGGDDTDTPITGPALAQASDAALAHVGQGRVTGTEVGDEDGYYEVEVTLDDGSQVDVALDEGFQVLGSQPDRETGESGDAGGD